MRPDRPGPQRGSLRRVLALALCLSLSGCFTMGLWGFDHHSDSSGDGHWELDESQWQADHVPWYWRLALTPLTLCADVATLCIQVWLFGDDDDDCEPPRRRRRGC